MSEHKDIAQLPCLICGTELEPAVVPAQCNQPEGGTAFSTRGHYGSNAFDPLDVRKTLQINICDSCLTDAASKGRVYYVTTLRREVSESTFEIWDMTES